MKQKDFASQAGIANSTVSEWKKKKTNPSSDKIMDICAVLGVTPEQLLTGKGIEDVTKAMEPLFTTRPELDRSGMGFSFMTAFMDQVEVSSEPGKGTIVKMKKTIGKGRKIWTTQSL